MIRISQMKLPVEHSEEELVRKIQKSLRLNHRQFAYEIIRQSLDARKKNDKKFVYTVDVCLSDVNQEKRILEKVHDKNIMLTKMVEYHFPKHGEDELQHRPVVVGSGPAGLFCAWYLAREGYRPIVFERGEEARNRKKTVEAFWEGKKLDPGSNVQFGEGGAGTFSDGKLNTLVKDVSGRNHEVLHRFVTVGAPKEILYQQKPHLGTDVLVDIVERLRMEIIEMGGEFHFRSLVTDIGFQDGRVSRIQINQERWMDTQVCVLAIGHSARDTFRMLLDHGVPMEPKAFAVGVRIEHPQKMINRSMYGEEENQRLGAASYKLTHTCSNGRSVYTFCMCPGGYVVNASSEEKRLAINGMSYQARDSANANSALIVTVSPQDFPGEDPLCGVRFQRSLEEAAYACGQGKIPVQTFSNFCQKLPGGEIGDVSPCMKGSWQWADVRGIFPEALSDAIEEGIHAFGKKIPGFDRPDAILSAVESRSSSPVRIRRNDEFQSEYYGIYPCGEGAGYAGGITSAAMDGIKVAEAIAKKYRNF